MPNSCRITIPPSTMAPPIPCAGVSASANTAQANRIEATGCRLLISALRSTPMNWIDAK